MLLSHDNYDLFNCRYLQPEYNLIKFFGHFERVVESRRTEEEQQNFKARDVVLWSNHCHNELLSAAARVYTPRIFKLLEEEHNKTFNLRMRRVDCDGYEFNVIDGNQYRVWSAGNSNAREYDVCLNREEREISCSCKMFENMGILCCHCLLIMNMSNAFMQNVYNTIPNKYIMKRWTMKPKNTDVGFIQQLDAEEGRGFMSRYRLTCTSVLDFALRISRDELQHNAWMKDLKALISKHSSLLNETPNQDHAATGLKYYFAGSPN